MAMIVKMYDKVWVWSHCFSAKIEPRYQLKGNNNRTLVQVKGFDIIMRNYISSRSAAAIFRSLSYHMYFVRRMPVYSTFRNFTIQWIQTTNKNQEIKFCTRYEIQCFQCQIPHMASPIHNLRFQCDLLLEHL